MRGGAHCATGPAGERLAGPFNSSSSPLTLKIMLGVVLCFLPVVIGYQTWVYLKFRDVITAKSLEDGPAY